MPVLFLTACDGELDRILGSSWVLTTIQAVQPARDRCRGEFFHPVRATRRSRRPRRVVHGDDYQVDHRREARRGDAEKIALANAVGPARPYLACNQGRHRSQPPATAGQVKGHRYGDDRTV
jgi:hypothetical protein